MIIDICNDHHYHYNQGHFEFFYKNNKADVLFFWKLNLQIERGKRKQKQKQIDSKIFKSQSKFNDDIELPLLQSLC